MKTLILSLSVATFLSGAAAMAQSTATTTPVGFISETVGGGTIASPQLTLVSPTLTQPIVFQGTISSISGTTITVNGATFTVGQFNSTGTAPNVIYNYYVEVFSATKPGAISDVVSNGSNTVTTVDNLTAFASVGDSIAIRQHVSIGSFLGTNNAYGLGGGNDISVADEVLVYNGAVPAVYWYYDGSLGGPAGWVDAGFNDASGVDITPHAGVVIKRKFAGNVTIVSTGTVKAGNTYFPVYNGLNVLGTLSASGLTLGSSGLYNGNSALKGSNDISTADEVLIYNGSVPSTYWYYDGSLGGAPGWVDAGFNDATSVSLAAGKAFVVNRKGGGAFNWVLPSPTSF